MTLQIDAFEAVWIVTNLAAATVTLFALFDARRDQVAIRIINGAVRTLIARGNVRREAVWLMVQLSLLSAIVPVLFDTRPVVLFAPALLVVSVLTLLLSVLDTADRHALNIITVADVVSEFERIAAEVARANLAAQAESKAAIAVIDEKVDVAAADATREIARTDEHQTIQDNRLDNVENHK